MVIFFLFFPVRLLARHVVPACSIGVLFASFTFHAPVAIKRKLQKIYIAYRVKELYKRKSIEEMNEKGLNDRKQTARWEKKRNAQIEEKR